MCLMIMPVKKFVINLMYTFHFPLALPQVCGCDARSHCRAVELHRVKCMLKQRKRVSLRLRVVSQEIKPISLLKLCDRKPFCGLYYSQLFPQTFHYVLEQHSELNIIIRIVPLMENKIYECPKNVLLE